MPVWTGAIRGDASPATAAFGFRRAQKRVAVFLPGLVLLTAKPPAGQAVGTVCPDGSCDFTSIQAAIDASQGGDTVSVAPDTYNELIVVPGLTIAVVAQEGPTSTIISVLGLGNSTVTFHPNASNAQVTPKGFAVRDGSGTFAIDACRRGGGIAIYHAAPAIEKYVLPSNTAEYGGGIYCDSSSPLKLLAVVLDSNIANSDNADFDGDGDVDGADIGLMLINWGPCL